MCIRDRLSIEIDKKVENAKSLVCTEENVKAIKQIRADLNKEFKEVEQQRKTVKEKILESYMQFEGVYKTYISDKYKEADGELKNKIDTTEDELRARKEQEVRDYFDEAGSDISGMSDDELMDQSEVFAIADGRFLVVEG